MPDTVGAGAITGSQIPFTQKCDWHSSEAMQLPPLGTPLRVGGTVGISVGVTVGVLVGVLVGVGVAVGVVVAVRVGVPVRVQTGAIRRLVV